MARSLTELQELLQATSELDDVYIQPPTDMADPCIVVERSTSRPWWANNQLYLFKKGYSVTVVTRDPDTLVPDRLESLSDCRFDRFFKVNGLNHFAFLLFF